MATGIILTLLVLSQATSAVAVPPRAQTLIVTASARVEVLRPVRNVPEVGDSGLQRTTSQTQDGRTFVDFQ